MRHLSSLPLLALLLPQAASALDPGCTAPFTHETWVGAMNEIDGALKQSEMGAARGGLDKVKALLPCLDQVAKRGHLARFARQEAMVYFFDQDEEAAIKWGLTARYTANDFPWAVPEDHPFRTTLTEADDPPFGGPGGGFLVAKNYAMFLNGSPQGEAKARAEVPNFLQVTDKKGVIVRAFWQDGAAFPAEIVTAGLPPTPAAPWYVADNDYTKAGGEQMFGGQAVAAVEVPDTTTTVVPDTTTTAVTDAAPDTTTTVPDTTTTVPDTTVTAPDTTVTAPDTTTTVPDTTGPDTTTAAVTDPVTTTAVPDTTTTTTVADASTDAVATNDTPPDIAPTDPVKPADPVVPKPVKPPKPAKPPGSGSSIGVVQLGAAGGLGVVAGALYVVAELTAGTLAEQPDTASMVAVRSKANTLVIGSAIAGAAALGVGATAFISADGGGIVVRGRF